MKTIKLYVKCEDRLVGTLALTKDNKVAFQYSESWLENGFSINPFSLPLSKEVFVPNKNYFNGLFGVFADSLPDSWGNLLVDRFLKNHNISSSDINVLDRLALIGNNGMGRLSYEPVKEIKLDRGYLSLDELSVECGKLLASKNSNSIDELYRLGGSSGGARPKVLLKLDNIDWLIKFSNRIDSADSGVMEYDYFKCAKECGINVPKTKLFNSQLTSGYFGIERFDIKSDKRIHMITVAGLLELDYESPSLDYVELIKLTKVLTNDKDTYEMFRRMCFNVFSHNLDDHSKNFSFLYDEDNKCWKLSPAYDLTYSNTYYGEHTTRVDGKGKNITEADLLTVGVKNKLNQEKCKEIINKVKECVLNMLSKYLNNV